MRDLRRGSRFFIRSYAKLSLSAAPIHFIIFSLWTFPHEPE